jgi:RNA polymerase sigma-70 factor, ECF subfamily
MGPRPKLTLEPSPGPGDPPEPQRTAGHPRISDEELDLVARAKAGDSDGFSGLVKLHQRRAYLVARSVVMTHEDAEDAVQEGFMRAYQALGRFDAGQSFGAWLYRIVANAALDLSRRRKVRAADELSDSFASAFRDPAEDNELRERLQSALATLPERARTVLVLHDIEGFTHAEIGELLGIPGGTARSDLHHARRKLKVLLANLRA